MVEVKKPKIRSIDFEQILKQIGISAEDKVEVDSLRPSNRSEVARIKETKAEKSYRIRFQVAG